MRKETFFYFFNLILIYAMTAFVYYPRNAENVKSSFVIVYSILMIVFPVLFWLKLRKIEVSIDILIVLQIGILLHFFGGIFVGGSRVYDQIVLGIRYDKFVHFFNSFAGFLGIMYIVEKYKLKLGKFEPYVVILIVIGLGCIVELIEYLGLKTLTLSYEPWSNQMLQPLYDNNMQDIFANLLGAITGHLFVKLKTKKN